MINPETNESKGYAFIEFANYKEFQTALNNTEPIIFGKQKLVFNLAKNKHDYNQYNQNIILENKENLKVLNTINISNNINHYNTNKYINEKEIINIKTSGTSDENNKNNPINSFSNSSLHKTKIKENQDNNTFNIDEINNYPIQEQIKYALKNMVNLYGKTNPYFLKSKICNYYCGPFLDRDIIVSNNFNESNKNI